nr:MAG TPA: hypothetical protein [Caudoviricetes sp.]
MIEFFICSTSCAVSIAPFCSSVPGPHCIPQSRNTLKHIPTIPTISIVFSSFRLFAFAHW